MFAIWFIHVRSRITESCQKTEIMTYVKASGSNKKYSQAAFAITQTELANKSQYIAGT